MAVMTYGGDLSKYLQEAFPNVGGESSIKVALQTGTGTPYTGYTGYSTTSTTFPQEKSSTVNLKTKVVELKAGFVGQVLHAEAYVSGGTIVWESKPKKSLVKAEKAAEKAKARAVARLFEEN